MRRNALGKKNKFNNGLTLIEGVISLAILAMIIVPFLHMFLYSTITNNKSEEIIDATYIAQNIMEGIYEDSLKGPGFIPSDEVKEYTDPLGQVYWVNQEVDVEESNDNKLVRVIIKVYSDETESELKAQMETYFLWKK